MLLINRKTELKRIDNTRAVISMLQEQHDESRASLNASMQSGSNGTQNSVFIKPPIHHYKADLMYMFSRKDLIDKMDALDVNDDNLLAETSRFRAESVLSTTNSTPTQAFTPPEHRVSEEPTEVDAKQLSIDLNKAEDIVAEAESKVHKRVLFSVDEEVAAGGSATEHDDGPEVAKPDDNDSPEKLPWSVPNQACVSQIIIFVGIFASSSGSSSACKHPQPCTIAMLLDRVQMPVLAYIGTTAPTTAARACCCMKSLR